MTQQLFGPKNLSKHGGDGRQQIYQI